MVNTEKRTVFNILVFFYIFSRGVAVAHEVLILIGWVRVLVGEITFVSGPSADNWKLQLKIYRRFGVWGLSCRKLQRVRSVERFESSTWL